MEDNIVWKARRRPIFGLPISFTTYELQDEKILVRSGLLNTQEEEVRLYRIMDITLYANLLDKIFGVGQIRCHSADKTTPSFTIGPIKDAKRIKEILSSMIEKVRNDKGITTGEFMGPVRTRE